MTGSYNYADVIETLAVSDVDGHTMQSERGAEVNPCSSWRTLSFKIISSTHIIKRYTRVKKDYLVLKKINLS